MLSQLLRWLNGAGVTSVSPVSLPPANMVPGTVFHLGDGRKLAFGESAEMTPELAAPLEKHNGQAAA